MSDEQKEIDEPENAGQNVPSSDESADHPVDKGSADPGSCAEQGDTEQGDTEQGDTEQSDTEQSSAEESNTDDTQPRSSTRLPVRSFALLFMWIMVGSAFGAGAYTFHYAEGTSYFSNDSLSCANCHVMQQHYDAWLKSSHSAHAQCNDCHSDPTSIFTKLRSKAINGLLHSYAFTTGDFHEPIRITEWNRKQTEIACRKCHEGMVHQIDYRAPNGEMMSCIRCHQDVGHPFK